MPDLQACGPKRPERHHALQPPTNYYYEPDWLWKIPQMHRFHKIAVLGAGTMGARIAAHFANAGIPAYLLDIVPPGTDPSARNKIAAAGLDAALKSKPAAFFESSLASMVTIGNFEDDLRKLAEVDWIIEAVVE